MNAINETRSAQQSIDKLVAAGDTGGQKFEKASFLLKSLQRREANVESMVCAAASYTTARYRLYCLTITFNHMCAPSPGYCLAPQFTDVVQLYELQRVRDMREILQEIVHTQIAWHAAALEAFSCVTVALHDLDAEVDMITMRETLAGSRAHVAPEEQAPSSHKRAAAMTRPLKAPYHLPETVAAAGGIALTRSASARGERSGTPQAAAAARSPSLRRSRSARSGRPPASQRSAPTPGAHPESAESPDFRSSSPRSTGSNSGLLGTMRNKIQLLRSRSQRSGAPQRERPSSASAT